MKKILLGLFLVAFYVALPIKGAVAQDVIPISIPTDPHTLVTYYAKKYKVSESKLNKIIKCESGWNTKALNHSSIEYSAGLVQINLQAHQHVTLAQAQDPQFAIRFLAYNMAKGRSSMWTCAR